MKRQSMRIGVAGVLVLAGASCGQIAAPSDKPATVVAVRDARFRFIDGTSNGRFPAAPVSPVARRNALAEGRRLFAAAILPRGSRIVASPAEPQLSEPGSGISACNPLLEGTIWWKVPEAPKALVAFLSSHVPAGLTEMVWGGGGQMSPGHKEIPNFITDTTVRRFSDNDLAFTGH
jgi:hypothetical protein